MSTDPALEEACERVLAAAKGMLATGLTAGTSGNVSERLAGGRVLITPSSVPYDAMTREDLVVLDADGEVVAGTRVASSEKLLHLACYEAFPEIGAVLHSHPVYATAFAVARRPIPPVVDEAVIYVGGEVPVADYAVSGSAEVGANAVARLDAVGTALLAGHGMVTVAAGPAAALHQAGVAERCAQTVLAAQALGGAVPLPQSTVTSFGELYRGLRAAR